MTQKASITELENQIKELQQDYNYNLREYTIEIALEKFKGKDFDYQSSQNAKERLKGLKVSSERMEQNRKLSMNWKEESKRIEIDWIQQSDLKKETLNTLSRQRKEISRELEEKSNNYLKNLEALRMSLEKNLKEEELKLEKDIANLEMKLLKDFREKILKNYQELPDNSKGCFRDGDYSMLKKINLLNIDACERLESHLREKVIKLGFKWDDYLEKVNNL